MKTAVFAGRNVKEIVRDLLTVFFGLAFPIVILLLLSAIASRVPDQVEMFNIELLSPGIAVFGLSFISLFSATLISKDRTTSYLMRLFASPLTPANFIFGYVLPMLPISVLQTVICLAVSVPLGLDICVGMPLMLLALIPADMLFVAIGLLCGSVLNDKQVGGICGALLTNLSAWLSGIWFDLELVGGWFGKVAGLLPFYHAVEAARAALAGNISGLFPHLWWVIGYAVVIFAVAVLAFSRKMKG